MATVHFVNGKYHVHYEFAEAAKRNGHENNRGTLKNENPTPDQIFFYDNSLENVTAIINIKYFSSPSGLETIHIYGEFHPPKC